MRKFDPENILIVALFVIVLEFIGGLLGLFTCSVLLDSCWHLIYFNGTLIKTNKHALVWQASYHVLDTIANVNESGSLKDFSFVFLVILYILAILCALHILFAVALLVGITRKQVWLLQIWLAFKATAIVLTTIVLSILLNHSVRITVIVAYILFLVFNVGFLLTVTTLMRSFVGIVQRRGSAMKNISLEDATASNGIIQRFVSLLEEKGLSTQGLYRVPGNKTEVVTLFQKLDKNPKIDIASLNLDIYVLATAFKQLISIMLYPPMISPEILVDIEQIVQIPESGNRYQQMKAFLSLLPPPNFTALQILFTHLAKVAAQSQVNSMGSANLAICWWPTLFPVNLTEMTAFQKMEPLFKDLVQTMIDQNQFFFGGEERMI